MKEIKKELVYEPAPIDEYIQDTMEEMLNMYRRLLKLKKLKQKIKGKNNGII